VLHLTEFSCVLVKLGLGPNPRQLKAPKEDELPCKRPTLSMRNLFSTWFDVMQTTYVILRRPTLQNLYLASLLNWQKSYLLTFINR